ncbi:transcriptional regulatory protein, C-terminal domain protein [Prevotella disiens FB035-09AN]|jgi:transcriptional regulatory protein, C-terminal domain protein|uniref:Transcriptional regulatory protein, C-terminal domain protein n=1 Tax=Prevotella disiens FB035-09AN TaxID=866771 RepID=E1KQS1_9BACT|nr:helix-turn-helix domain-containing protein [Prevotella disiens]EFL46179.1 transcriptional regulatory protein, C-terminal domain protein [Prevotella disiens FB035-09AN]
MKPYLSVIVFLFLVLSSATMSIKSYNGAKDTIVADMNQALEQTLQTKTEAWITPDTIINYRKNLKIETLRNESFLTYAAAKTPQTLCSRRMEWKNRDKENIVFQSYATCSALTIWQLSDQRYSTFTLLLAFVWLASSIYWIRKSKLGTIVLNSFIYSSDTQTFYDLEQKPIPFTPMQLQLMQLFLAADHHQLSKQTICDTLWQKKPDASETLYTLIRRTKVVLKERVGLKIVTERGGNYRLEK